MALSPQIRRRLEEAHDGLEAAKQERDDAMAEAHRKGGTIREIAEAVGLSHVWVSKRLDQLGVRRRLTGEEFERRRGRW